MQDISVIYVSYVTLLPGMGNVPHSHDYWHFSAHISGATRSLNSAAEGFRPCCRCFRPGTPHGGMICTEKQQGINIMFFVNDPKLEKQLEQFNFESLGPNDFNLEFLLSIANQIHSLNPSQEFIDSSVSYYFHLLLETPRPIPPKFVPQSIADKCLSYIDENYMHPFKLENLAEHIGRTKTHTSYLVSSATGQTVVEHLNEVRIKHACTQLAYSAASLDEVATSCGYTSTKHFCRVFKELVGCTPTRYRTSHSVDDMFYDGDSQDLNVPYDTPAYTYVPRAQKIIDWKTPLEYLSQSTNI